MRRATREKSGVLAPARLHRVPVRGLHSVEGLAFGLTVLTMAYAVGHVSGAHFNPAVTIGLAVAKRFEWRDAPAYNATQVVAGLVAGGLLELIASGKPGFVATGNTAAKGYGVHSPVATASARPWPPRSCWPDSSSTSSSARRTPTRRRVSRRSRSA